MNSLILRTATLFLLVLLLLYSVFVLWRGHNEPGGGFIGGLIAAGAFTLYSIAYGSRDLYSLLRVDPRTLIGVGLVAALASGLLALLTGTPFLNVQWATLPFGEEGFALGSALLFDVGVFLVVIGFVLTFVLSLDEA